MRAPTRISIGSGVAMWKSTQGGVMRCRLAASAKITSAQRLPPALKRLVSNGALLRAFPQPVLEACYKAASGIYADLSKTNPHFKKLYESLVPYRNDAYAWQQVAEIGFDSFQIRMRART